MIWNRNYVVMSILVTGGLGYIGSHTVVELVQSNYDQIIIVVKIPVVFSDRRQGDVQTSYCNHEYTYEKINWKTEKSLRDICIDAWRSNS